MSTKSWVYCKSIQANSSMIARNWWRSAVCHICAQSVCKENNGIYVEVSWAFLDPVLCCLCIMGGGLCHLAGTNTYHERSMINIQGYKWLATRSMLVTSVKIDPIFTRQPFELQQNIPHTIIEPLSICTTPYW